MSPTTAYHPRSKSLSIASLLLILIPKGAKYKDYILVSKGTIFYYIDVFAIISFRKSSIRLYYVCLLIQASFMQLKNKELETPYKKYALFYIYGHVLKMCS